MSFDQSFCRVVWYQCKREELKNEEEECEVHCLSNPPIFGREKRGNNILAQEKRLKHFPLYIFSLKICMSLNIFCHLRFFIWFNSS